MTNEMILPEEYKTVIVKLRPTWDIHNGTPYLAFAHVEDDGKGPRWYTKDENGYDVDIGGVVIGWMDMPDELKKELGEN